MEIEKNILQQKIYAERYEYFKGHEDEVLGRSSYQPFEALNSANRKLMHANQKKQAKCIKKAQYPLISTGREDLYGQESSAFIQADSNLRVIAKISRYSMYPDHEYYLITINDRNEMDIIERKAYQYNTESFGFLWNNEVLDSLQENSVIPAGEVYKKSQSFDEFNHYMPGVNLLSTYMSLPNTTQDPVIISTTCQEKLRSPEFAKFEFKLNENDILINCYGNDEVHKGFPDLGEYTKDGILCAIRKTTNNTSIYDLSRDNINKIFISDESIICREGKVVDIKVYSNKQLAPGKEEGELYNTFEGQLAAYINDENRFCRQFVEAMANYINNSDYTKSYALKKMHNICQRKLNGDLYMEDGKILSNIKVEIVVYMDHVIQIGDKVSNRFGGKGVISEIRPDHLMPRLPGTDIPVDIVWDESTCVSRLNIGQLSEISVNHISRRILERFDTGLFSVSDIIEDLVEYYRLTSPNLASWIKDSFESCRTDDEVNLFLSSFLEDSENAPRGLYIQVKPLTETIDFDTIRNIYRKFPWIKQEHLTIPMECSDGTWRYVPSNKPSTVGSMYVYVLKQEARDKFSSTSLSPTNSKGENSKSKEAKTGRASHSNTPIRWGEMELAIMLNINSYIVVKNLMIMSTAEIARREGGMSMLLGDSYNVDIDVPMNAKSRAAEKTVALLKAMGVRYVFKKIPKIKKPLFTRVEKRKDLFTRVEKRTDLFVKVDEVKPVFTMATEEDKRTIQDSPCVSFYQDTLAKLLAVKKK